MPDDAEQMKRRLRRNRPTHLRESDGKYEVGSARRARRSVSLGDDLVYRSGAVAEAAGFNSGLLQER